MSDDLPPDFARDFVALMKVESRSALDFTPYEWWCLMAAVQLASRHPKGRKLAPLLTAIDVARVIQGHVAQGPALARVAEQGWDPNV